MQSEAIKVMQMTVPPSSLFAEAMSALFSAQQVVDLIFSDAQEEQEINYLEGGGI